MTFELNPIIKYVRESRLRRQRLRAIRNAQLDSYLAQDVGLIDVRQSPKPRVEPW